MIDKQTVLIVGGGWAGLSSALRLKHKGYTIQLFESCRQLGGRARCTQYKGKTLDNGQHMLLGSCVKTLELFQLLGMHEADYLYRESLKLAMLDVSPNKHDLHIQASNLPEPLNLLFGFIKARGITLKEKYYLIRFFSILRFKNYQLNHDCDLLHLLVQQHQSKSIIHQFWEPLCLAIMNTPIAMASAQIFVNVLKASFDGQTDIKLSSTHSTKKIIKNKNSDLLFFSRPLCETLADNASRYLQTEQSSIHFNTKINSLHIENNSIAGIKIADTIINTRHLILATPAHISAKLLAPYPCCNLLVSSLQKINYQPIYTIYLYYQQRFNLDNKMTGILNGYSQWVFDKSLCQQQGLLAVIISGHGKHQQLSREALINKIDNELQSLFTLPELDWGLVIKENKATINCSVKNNQNRPSNQTPIKNLYLAGDYTDTLYPSTLEGAVLSGKKAANYIKN